MGTKILDLSAAPDDALERLLWLSGVAEEAKAELEAEYQQVYFQARLEQRIGAALDLHLHPARRVIAWTRHENQSRGRSVRWNDGFR